MQTTITIVLDHNGLIDKDVAVKHLLSHIEEIEQSNYKRIDDMIEFSLKNKIIIQMAKEQYRGLGKTVKLAQKAKEIGATLVVPNGNALKYVMSEGFYTNVTYFSDATYTRGHRYKDGFLVDEGVHPDIIKALSEHNELLGGFSRV